MAKAELVREVDPDAPYITLTLSERELRVINTLLAFVAGRGPADTISTAIGKILGDNWGFDLNEKYGDWDKVAFEIRQDGSDRVKEFTIEHHELSIELGEFK